MCPTSRMKNNLKTTEKIFFKIVFLASRRLDSSLKNKNEANPKTQNPRFHSRQCGFHPKSQKTPAPNEPTYEALAVKPQMLDMVGRCSPGCPSPSGRSICPSQPSRDAESGTLASCPEP